jgi:tetratricopeptide (TPR) repeat protein
MKGDEELNKTFARVYNLIGNGQYHVAFDCLRDLKTPKSRNILVGINMAGFLIDIGYGLKDPKIVETGLSQAKRLLRKVTSPSLEGPLLYNIANAFNALFRIKYEGHSQPPIPYVDELLQEVKSFLRKAIEKERYLEEDLKKRLWTNYGNCLDNLNRSAEAIYAYDKVMELDPQDPMALGNKAIALMKFADISGAYRIAAYIKSYQMLKRAISFKDEIAYKADVSAVVDFSRAIETIEKRVHDKNILRLKIKHDKIETAGMTDFEKAYIDFCTANRLFLNLHIHEEECEPSVVDSIFISPIRAPEASDEVWELIKYLNQVKEDFSVARLLLFQSQFKRDDLIRISRRTTLVNTPIDGAFNLYIGLLKAAFKEVYGILDKIAVFMNKYYNIGLDDKCICYDSFNSSESIWKNDRHEIREEISGSTNPSLYALYDIALDFNSRDYERYRQIRNSLVHRKLVVLLPNASSDNRVDHDERISYDILVARTIGLFQIVRSAIVYLVNGVQFEELRDSKYSTHKIVRVQFDTEQTFPFDD